MNGTKNDSGDNSLYSDHDSNSGSGVEARHDGVKDLHHMEVDRLDDESNNWSRQSNAGSSEESDTEGHRDTMNITLESDISGAGGDPLDSIRSPSPSSDARNDDESSSNRNHSIRIVNLVQNRKHGSSRSRSISPIDGKTVSGYSSSVDVKSPMEVRSRSVSPVEVKSGSSSPLDLNSESDEVDSMNDEKEINTIDSDSDDEDCMIVDDATKAKAREMNEAKEKEAIQEVEEVKEDVEVKEEVKKETEEAVEETKGEDAKPAAASEVTETKVKEEVKKETEESPESGAPTVRRSLRNTQRKKYEDPGEDDIQSDGEGKRRKDAKGKSPIKATQPVKAGITNLRAITIGQSPMVRFPNALNMGKGMHNGVVSSNVINNMAQRGVSITPTGARNVPMPMPVKKPPPRPKRQPAFPPESIFANMSNDMNVIEAPSFLSPFMFVKKPVESLKKFVDEISKEIEEEKRKEMERKAEEERKLREEQEAKAKLEKENMEKEMIELAEKAQNEEKMDVDEGNQERGEKRENGEANKEEPSKKKVARRRRKNNDEADESWSEGDATDSSDDELAHTVILKPREEGLDALKVATSISRGEIKSDLDPKVQAYFSTPLGNFFIDIGFNLVQERVQTDLLKLQQKKLRHSTKSVDAQSMEAAMNLLTSNIERLKRDNFPFNFSRVRCQFCSFKTESALVMANHMEVPHTAKNGLFRCNFCPTEFQSPQLILSHVSTEHGVTARLLKPQSAYECADCPFESQTKGRYLKHVEKCSKLQTEVNILKPQEWQPPAKLIKASARPSYNYNYRPRAPIPARPTATVFRPVQPTPVVPGGVRPIRPNEGFNPSLIGIRPRPVIAPRPAIIGARPGTVSNLKCGMCGSYYPDATRLREHVMRDHARGNNININVVS